jgi:mannosyltransferase OCH1-like enzyme
MSEEFIELHKNIIKSAPKCDVVLLRDNECRELAKEYNIEDIYMARSWIFQADIARALAVHKYGGWYFDLDFELYVDPADIPKEDDEFIVLETSMPCYEYCAFYAKDPGHPALERYIKRLHLRKNVKNPLFATGPCPFTENVNVIGGNITKLPRQAFLPEKDEIGLYGRHLFAGTWYK